jgi:hypothetical protein
MLKGVLLTIKFLHSSWVFMVLIYDKLIGLSEKAEGLVGGRTCVGGLW